jgi:hypothetical protein
LTLRDEQLVSNRWSHSTGVLSSSMGHLFKHGTIY